MSEPDGFLPRSVSARLSGSRDEVPLRLSTAIASGGGRARQPEHRVASGMMGDREVHVDASSGRAKGTGA
jgi:hypothetical protein